MLCFNIEICL